MLTECHLGWQEEDQQGPRDQPIVQVEESHQFGLLVAGFSISIFEEGHQEIHVIGHMVILQP